MRFRAHETSHVVCDGSPMNSTTLTHPVELTHRLARKYQPVVTRSCCMMKRSIQTFSNASASGCHATSSTPVPEVRYDTSATLKTRKRQLCTLLLSQLMPSKDSHKNADTLGSRRRISARGTKNIQSTRASTVQQKPTDPIWSEVEPPPGCI